MWVVVLVESGIPTLVETYLTESDAAVREQFLQNAMRLEATIVVSATRL